MPRFIVGGYEKVASMMLKRVPKSISRTSILEPFGSQLGTVDEKKHIQKCIRKSKSEIIVKSIKNNTKSKQMGYQKVRKTVQMAIKIYQKWGQNGNQNVWIELETTFSIFH